jgi:hypothetical protein
MCLTSRNPNSNTMNARRGLEIPPLRQVEYWMHFVDRISDSFYDFI